MRSLQILVITAAAITAACSAHPRNERPRPAEPAASPPVEELVIPMGDYAAGRQAFLDLYCHACHTVDGDPSLPAPVSANPGPALGAAQAQQQLGTLVTSIVTPSHQVDAALRARLEGNLSPMGDFSDAMTVRQLVDLVAYLRAAKEEG